MTFRIAAIKIAAPILLLTCWSDSSLAETAMSAGPTMLVYGNYCGYGNNAPLAPIDALDAACARHDACTPDDDLPTKACNVRLEQEAEDIALDLSQPDNVRMMAGLVSAFAANHQFKATPDVASNAVRVPTSRPTYMTLR